MLYFLRQPSGPCISITARFTAQISKSYFCFCQGNNRKDPEVYLEILQCQPPPDWKLPPTGPIALAVAILSWARASLSHTDPDLFWHCSDTKPADVALPLRGAALSVLPSNPNTPATRACPYGRPTLPVSGPETASPGLERKNPLYFPRPLEGITMPLQTMYSLPRVYPGDAQQPRFRVGSVAVSG